jgi:predicted small metal-binding protein
MIKFKCKDFLLKECEFEAKGTHSVDEMMKLIEVHAGEEHRTLKLQPETIERIRSSLAKQSGLENHQEKKGGL